MDLSPKLKSNTLSVAAPQVLDEPWLLLGLMFHNVRGEITFTPLSSKTAPVHPQNPVQSSFRLILIVKLDFFQCLS